MKWTIHWKGYLKVVHKDGSKVYFAQIQQGMAGYPHFSKRKFRRAMEAVRYAFRWIQRLNYDGLG